MTPITVETIVVEKPWGSETLLISPLSVISNGEYSGNNINFLCGIWKKELLGNVPLIENQFPVCVKIIQTHGPLSIQNHPIHLPEEWIILDTKDGATVGVGLKDGLSMDNIKSDAKDYDLFSKYIKTLDVKPYDNMYICGGEIHYIGKNIKLLEIKNSCEVTHRISDQHNRKIDIVSAQNAYRHKTNDPFYKIWNVKIRSAPFKKSGQMTMWFPITSDVEICYGNKFMIIPKHNIALLPATLDVKMITKNVDIICIECGEHQ